MTVAALAFDRSGRFGDADRSGDAVMVLAFDRSNRWKDEDGRLHVAWTNISKAVVNPYYGREIPGYEALGLDPGRVYQLFRHPDELAKAAQTFNRMPLLSVHKAVSAADPQEHLIAGALGSEAEFRAPFLGNSLTIWRQEDIDDVESREKCELSCAYYYDPDMAPGEYQGLKYDGVMRNIRANHVALVPAGRAGPDVMVHDEMMFTLTSDASFEENKHPRDTDGKFGSGGGGKKDDGPVNVSFKDPHPFVFKFLNDHINHESREKYLKTVPTEKLHTALKLIGENVDTQSGTVRRYVKAEIARREGVKATDQEFQPMPQAVLASRKALIVKGALAAYLNPRLMPGTVLALDSAIGSVNRLNWRTQKPAVMAAVTALATPKLAKDATLDDMHEFMDRLDGEEDGGAEDDDLEAMDADMTDEEREEEKKARAEDASKSAKDRKMGKDARKAARDAKRAMDAKRAKDAEGETEEEKKAREAKEAEDKAKDGKAMDAAITKAVTDAEARVIARMNAIAEARELVRPHIGNVPIAMDSAADVLKLALDHHKVDLTGVDPSAYRAILSTIAKPGTSRPAPMAMDHSDSGGINKRFPQGSHIRLS